MDLVIDANILFSVLIKKGKTEEIIFKDTIHLFAPEFLFDEFEKYREFIKDKTKRNDKDFDRLMRILREKIIVIPNEETERFISKAKTICPDKNDVDYFALAMKLNCSVWSNDKALKNQRHIDVISTEELVNKVE
jgi:predicted nucleic acid-binding protein